MADTTFMIVFDPLDPRFDPVRVKTALKGDDRISHWWNHLANCFIVTSGITADQLAESVRDHAAGVSFLVTRADLTDSEGVLPRTSWRWIRKREREAAIGA